MSFEDIKTQYQRLQRHYKFAITDKNEVSFLDLAHCLRIWADMKKEVDLIIKEKKINIKFPNNVVTKNLKDALKGHKYYSIPLSSGGGSNEGIQITGMRYTFEALTPEEIMKRAKLGRPLSKNVDLTFSQWLGSEVIEFNENGNERLGISREMIIRRVANMLGASHPKGMEEPSEDGNRFDTHISFLHSMCTGGVPLTYCQLIEIADIIIKKFKIIFN
ncbi:hypothetical protein LL033_18080 [Clostridium estertheticum]|uniref:hypothetical protein n=1 Tax=Clostridium estertheticum TaxID=238834 RepID=UPI001C0AF826|nr:hypothetical protein [Clostridium estertheticum]MBU3216577.1 hypothetical protein [Clostridium estertheticum]WAG54513.1 hypothetical protein LL033_18080 [Clostridium estertheticum]